MGKQKKPKQRFDPHERAKQPRDRGGALNVVTQKFSWSFAAIDLDGPFGWRHVDLVQLLTEIVPKLHEHESMTWGEIEGSRSHFVEIDKLSDAARARLTEIEKDDFGDLFSLRLSGASRVWGTRTSARFDILWWDPNHLVCPSVKKHT